MIPLRDENDNRIYRKTLIVVLITAFKNVFPGRDIIIHRSVNKCTFCEVIGRSIFDQYDIEKLKNEMKRLIDADLPITKSVASKDELKELYSEMIMHYDEKGIVKDSFNIFSLENVKMHLLGTTFNRTSQAHIFDIQSCDNGFLLKYPNYSSSGRIHEFTGSERLMSAISEYSIWSDILDIHNVTQLNSIVNSPDARDMVLIQESLQEKRISQIADIISSRPKCKTVLISGPSSSGKTTFTNKLNIQLRVLDIEPIIISLDDYYLPIEKMPKKEDGSYNFEELESIDYKLFNSHLEGLIAGEEVKLPRFEFKGKKTIVDRTICLKESQILLVEGIHALNDKISYCIKPTHKFKIYCSPLIDLNLDNYNPVSPTDIRLIRRMVRDSKFRDSSAENTLNMWKNVQEGEYKNIFPYESHSDIIFNSATIYEFSLFRSYAEKLLNTVPETSDKYEEAQRLLVVLSNFASMDDKYVSSTALIREFIGGSAYYS